MNRIGIAIAVLLLSGCSSEASRAERAYEIAERAGNRDDSCTAAKQAAAAHLKGGNEEAYKLWSNKSTVDCYLADTDPRRGALRF